MITKAALEKAPPELGVVTISVSQLESKFNNISTLYSLYI
jgi:hypothetical protein